MTEHHHYNAFIKTIFISLSGWMLYVFSDTITKWLTDSYSVSEIMVVSYTAGLLLIVPYIGLRYGWKAFLPERTWKLHVMRGISGALGTVVGVHALHLIPLTDFYGVVFLTPLLLCLMSHFILKERIGKHRITAIVVGFMGVLVLAGPQFSAGSAGYLFALSAVIFAASNGILVRKIGRETVLLRFAFYVFAANVVINLPILMMEDSFVMPQPGDIALFLAIPPIVMGGLIAYSVAFSRVKETAMIAPFHYSQIIWGAILGYFLFHEVPTARTVIGAAIIIGAGLYMIWREYVLHKASVIRSLPR